MADNFIKHILILESLIKSDHESPKTARQIQSEVERRLKEISPNEPDSPISLLTIRRQIKAIRESGLYRIKTHEDNKRGCYNANHLLSTADAAIISSAIYRKRAVKAPCFSCGNETAQKNLPNIAFNFIIKKNIFDER